MKLFLILTLIVLNFNSIFCVEKNAALAQPNYISELASRVDLNGLNEQEKLELYSYYFSYKSLQELNYKIILTPSLVTHIFSGIHNNVKSEKAHKYNKLSDKLKKIADQL